MSDPYIPLETKLGYTRRALELIDRYGFGVAIQTKSDRILRDLDLLTSINQRTRAVVQMTLTTYDDALCRKVEPGVCPTSRRFAVLKEMRDVGIPTVVWLSPILPFLNDTEENIRGILELCAEAGVYGVICFGMGLTLREGNREYFYQQLDRQFPGLSERYRQCYGFQYEVESPDSGALMRVFHETCEKYGMVHNNDAIFAYLRRFEEKETMQQLGFL